MSVLVHAALLLELPALRVPAPAPPDPVGLPDRLTVRIAPPFDVAPEVASRPAPAPQARKRPPPPVVAADRPAPKSAPATVTAPAGDLLAYVEARRRARGPAVEAPAAAPAEDENARASRIAAANLAPPRMASFGYDPAKSGGVFTIERMSYDYAEFTFIGWNNDVRRRTKQVIEVRKGDARDIRVAVVRKIIAIIREHEPEEFDWYSERLNRSIRLSAHARDNAGLEDFMMWEFFGRSQG